MGSLLGAVTIGQAPRADGLGDDLRRVLGPALQVRERGALDGLDAPALRALAPEPGQPVLTTLLRDGTSITLAEPAVVPLLQGAVADLERAGAAAILVLCTGHFPPFAARCPVLVPQAPLEALVGALAAERRLGVVVPLPAQTSGVVGRWRAAGVDALVAAGSPYAAGDEVTPACRELAAAGAELVYLDCFGFGRVHRRRAEAVLGRRPVLVARTLAARVLAELAGEGAEGT